MARLFHYKVINNAFGDPCVFIRLLREKRALMFDAGDIRKIPFNEILKISDIFVTHTHIDHFIGFDQILRAILRRAEPLRVYGPENIIDCVYGKLRGYTWNLVSDYPLTIEVYAITEKKIKRARFQAREKFRIEKLPSLPKQECILKESLFKVKALVLSHGIPVIAYCIEEDFHININKIKLEEKGFNIGPWLGELKKLIKIYYNYDPQKMLQPKDSSVKVMINTPKGEILVEELFEIVNITKGEKISYVMDIAPTEENIKKIVEFVKDSDVLFCEAYFLNKDMERAIERNHLTASLTGKIAKEAGVKEVVILHISPKYIENSEEVYREVELSRFQSFQ
ncbi:ribonuclease Z [Thermodesulfovibrio aggregans]|uniref:Ribonuclease Z n=1 Tax=Thermodesulfovibrio aggregans TaxID=86166 RepID=A0A0U9HUZ3_9BACT|nr:ribonuclease Z [Thermodesulfovibrio aggregans]GAQ95754.1 ribonuclease Z [Thermodesulfovibrio aggregans]